MAGVEGTGNQPQKNIIKHKLVKKENLFTLARKYNVSIHDIAKANGWRYDNKTEKLYDLKTNAVISLNIDKIVQIPKVVKNAVVGQTTEVKAPVDYTVKSGDNPSTIAEKYGISLRQLAHANGWQVETKTNKKGQEYTAITKDGDNLVLGLNQKIKLPESVTKSFPKFISMADAQKKTGMSDGFVEIIRKFEGNPDNNYKPYKKAYLDDTKTWTIGYGETKGVTSTSKLTAGKEEAEANAMLAKNYLQIKADLKIVLGEDIYEKMPKSLQEGCIDLIFNKGFEALDVERFKTAIKENSITEAMECLICTTSTKTGEVFNGLYKRSLARLVTVYEGLKGERKIQAKSVVDSFYAECEGRLKKEELNVWWTSDVEPVEEISEVEEDAVVEEVSQEVQHKAPVDSISAEIVKIKESGDDDATRLENTKKFFVRMAQKNKLSDKAVEIFNQVAEKEYDAIFFVDTDKMTAMTDIVDAKDAEELYKAINNAISESDEAKIFAAEVLASKIDETNIAKLIELYGDNKSFVNAMKKVGGFAILKHSLASLVGKDSPLLIEFNKAAKEEDYSEVKRIFDNITAKKASEIGKNLDDSLYEDDDLNAILYQYQMGKVNVDNVLEVLRSKDIIAGICEAENDRPQIKAEIMRLFNIIDKNYDLDDTKRKEFLDLIDKELQERSINPSTWWIGTKEISAKFNSLIAGELEFKNMTHVIEKELGFSIDDEKNRISGLKNKALVEKFEPTSDGALSGRTIVINSGHGGVGPNGFDVGARNEELGVDEWIVSRLIAQRVITKLQEQGANVVLTAAQVKNIPLESFNADVRISLHLDVSRDSMTTQAMDVYAFKGDAKDKALAQDIMFELHNDLISEAGSSEVMNEFKINWNDKHGVMGWDIPVDGNLEIGDTIRTRVNYKREFQALRGPNKKASKVPAALIEMCRMGDTQKVRSLIAGEYGELVVNSIVEGIERYLDK